MLHLGDIVVPFTTSRNPLYPLECTINEILRLDSTGKYLYGVSGHTALFDEYNMRLVQSIGLQPKYNIGDIIITDKKQRYVYSKRSYQRHGIWNHRCDGSTRHRNTPYR